MKKRSVLLPLPLILVTLVIGFGCGGAGSGGSTTTATSTTGTTGTTSTTGTSGPSISVTEVPAVGYVTVASPNVTLTASVSGVTDPKMQWSFTTESLQNEGFQEVLAPPGSQGAIQTVSGTNIDGQMQSASTVVYAGNNAVFTFGGNDTVVITAWSSKLPNGQVSKYINIPTGTDWVTLPTTITSPIASIGGMPTTVKPGQNVQVTVHLIPGFSCTSAVIAPSGFTPTNVTVNGSAASFPLSYTFQTTAPPVTLTVGFTVPSSQTDAFPVDATSAGLTGPWLGTSGSGLNGPWAIATPFFIHT